MYLNPFDGPRAKIARSKRHFDELVAAQAAYSKEQPLHLEARSSPNGGMELVATATLLPPLEAATIVADILGNLRSSLDLAVCEAARLSGAKSVRGTYFHAALSEYQWDCSVGGRMVAAPDWLVKLVRELQPWEGGNKLLYCLSKLAATDKHQLLIPIAGGAGKMTLDGVRFKHADPSRSGGVRVQGQMPQWDECKREAVLFAVDAGSEIEIYGPGVLHASFSFGDVYGLPYQPVIGLLNQMGSLCEQIIDRIEAATKSNCR